MFFKLSTCQLYQIYFNIYLAIRYYELTIHFRALTMSKLSQKRQTYKIFYVKGLGATLWGRLWVGSSLEYTKIILILAHILTDKNFIRIL